MATKEIVKKNVKGVPVPHLQPFQFKPGQSGNPAGIRKGSKWSVRRCLLSALKGKGFNAALELMKQKGIDMYDGTHGELIVACLLWKAEHGDLDAIKEIFKQTEKPLAREFDPEDPNPEGNSINVTMNIVKVLSKTTNIQNNINKIINAKSKKIKLKRIKLKS